MPYVQSDGARLYYETAGSGTPIVFVHEFSGDLWSWEKQIQHFSRRYHCVAFNARGYPPSDVPTSSRHYSHSKAVDDVAAVMRHLKLEKAHIVGCSMGSRTALDFGLRYPQMAMSVTMIGIGSGGDPRQADFKEKAEARAKLYEEGGLAEVLKGLSEAPNRIQLKAQESARLCRILPTVHEPFRRGQCLRHPSGHGPPALTVQHGKRPECDEGAGAGHRRR